MDEERALTPEEINRVVAETAKTEIDIVRVKQDIELGKLDILKRTAEVSQAEAQARTYAVQAKAAELEMLIKQRTYDETVAGDKFNFVYRFTEIVKEATVEHCMDKLTVWHRTHPEKPIEVLFYSPGGDVFAGMALYDFIRDLRAKGHAVTTGAYGQAASMAGVLLQAGTERWMGEQTYLLIHEAGTQLEGKQGELKDRMILLEKMMEASLNIYAKRSKEAFEAGTAKKAWSPADIKKKITKTDWWITSKEALEAGFVDRIGGPADH